MSSIGREVMKEEEKEKRSCHAKLRFHLSKMVFLTCVWILYCRN